MPIIYRLDHARHIVIAVGHGRITDDDVFDYQHDVWSRADVVGFDELIDWTQVTEVALPSASRVRILAAVSASMDNSAPQSRLAIVAPSDFAYGLGRMFQAQRQLDANSTKVVGVFRTMADAIVFLGLKQAPEMPAIT